MQSERLHLKENETLESAIYRQISLNRKSSAIEKSFDYQPEFESSIRSIKAESKIYTTETKRKGRKETGRRNESN